MRANLAIRVITSTVLALASLMKSFYTTADVNMITWDAAYSLFPRSTYIKHKTWPLQKLDEYFCGLHARFNERGWRTKVPTGHQRWTTTSYPVDPDGASSEAKMSLQSQY